MRRNYLTAAIVIGAIFIVSEKLYAEPGVLLDYKWVEGKELVYETKTTVNSTVEMGEGMTQTSLTTINLKTKGIVDEIRGDTVIVTISCEYAEGTVKGGAQSTPVPGMDGIVGSSAALTIVGNEILDEEFSDDLSEEAGSQLDGIISGFESDLELLSSGEEIEIGDEWDYEYEREGRKTTAHYKFEGVEKIEGLECAKITYSSQISIVQEQTQQGLESKYTGEGEGNGYIYFAVNERHKVNEKNAASIEGVTEIPSMNMSFDVYTDVTTETFLIQNMK